MPGHLVFESDVCLPKIVSKRLAKPFYCKTILQIVFLVPKQGLGNEKTSVIY
jgi:hypothetical protein